MDFIASFHPAVRILLIVSISIAAHLLVRAMRSLMHWVLAVKGGTGTAAGENLPRRYPRTASLMTILVGAVTFAIYFMAVGLILNEFKVSLTAYLASASVIGLAIGFGAQGLVQDVVTGLTLIFSEALNIQEVVEISGQVGRVESIGLRFTTLVNLHGQRIFIPNRAIGVIGRFRNGCIRAYVDVQLPQEVDEKLVVKAVESVVAGMKSQHRSIIIGDPENQGIRAAEKSGWRYLRIKVRIWPGQGALIEGPLKQRVISALKALDPGYSDWMVTITYKAESV